LYIRQEVLILDEQLLTIMSNSIGYLTTRSNFVQVSPEIPITKQRNPEKYDTPEVFEGRQVLIGNLTILQLNIPQRIKKNS
jgi:mediator of RNA polymerase II transcription subunit 21